MFAVLEQSRNSVVLDVGHGCAITYAKTREGNIRVSAWEAPMSRGGDPEMYVRRRIGGSGVNRAFERASELLNPQPAEA